MSKFTLRDLRQPNETLSDKVETISLTRGDVIFLNTAIGIMNKVINNPDFQRENMTVGMLFATDELRPGTLNLVKVNPRLFKEHVEQYSIEMAKKQEEYFQKYPEKRPPEPKQVDPRDLIKQKPVPTPDEPVTSPFKDDTGVPVETFDGTDTVIVTRGDQGVDAESTQQVEQNKVEADEV